MVEKSRLNKSVEKNNMDDEERKHIPDTGKESENTEEEKVARPFHLLDAHLEPRTRVTNYHTSGSLKAVQAIVLAAGTGSRMSTLVNDTNKCLLQIATMPMVYYPICMLQKSGFTECIVVVSSGCEAAVANFAKDYGLTIKLKIHTVDPTKDPGTLDSIRSIAATIRPETEDLIIVSSDIISDVKVSDMFRTHRYKGAALTMLTTPYSPKAFGPTPGLKQKSTIGPDIVMESMSQQQLSRSVCGGDYEEQINIPYSVHKAGSVLATMDTQDAHLYIVAAKLLKQYILSKTSPCANMTSLKAEVVPHLIAQQHRTNKNVEYLDAVQSVNEPFASLIQSFNTSLKPGRYSQYRAESSGGRACYSYHYDTGYCVRANTIPAYWYINNKIRLLYKSQYPVCPFSAGTASTCFSPNPVVVGNSLLGQQSTVDPVSKVINSSIGSNCKVEGKNLISNSVIYDNVSVAPGCVIENSLICCSVDKACIIKNSIVASVRTLSLNQTVSGDTLESTQFFA